MKTFTFFGKTSNSNNVTVSIFRGRTISLAFWAKKGWLA
jgi:hypothetical protein